MSENKTKPTNAGVVKFLNSATDDRKRSDSLAILELMKSITGIKPKMWGPTMVGFGSYHYKYDSGREGDYFIVGFSPRKQALTIYIMSGLSRYEKILSRLGKYKIGKSCLYIKKLEDVDTAVLTELIKESYQHMMRSNG